MEDNEFNKVEEVSSVRTIDTYSIGGPNEVLPKKSKGATASMILGIISLVGTFFWVIHIFPLWVMPYVGLFLGISAAKRFKEEDKIKTTAKAGIIMCGISIGLIIITDILFIILCVGLANSFGDGTDFMNGLNSFMNQCLAEIKNTDPNMFQQYYDMYYAEFPEWFEGLVALFCRF